MTEGSVSTNKALGTYESVWDEEKKDVESVVSRLTVPSILMPCSRQNNSQHADPTWTPACPMCTHINSPCVSGGDGGRIGGGGGDGGLTIFLATFLGFLPFRPAF